MATEHSENKVKTSVFSNLRGSSQPQTWGDSERRQLQAAETDKPVLDVKKTAIVRRIFDLCSQGLGFAAIAKALKNTPSISDQRSRGWSPTYVRNILTVKTVIGYCDMVEPPVKCYPAAVDEKTYFTANAKIKGRRHQTAPRKYAGTGSLFKGLCVCAKCGQPLFRNTSKTGSHRHHWRTDGAPAGSRWAAAASAICVNILLARISSKEQNGRQGEKDSWSVLPEVGMCYENVVQKGAGAVAVGAARRGARPIHFHQQ